MIESLKAREQQLHKKLDMNIKVLQNYESALHSMRTSYDSLEEENDRTKLSNFEMKERIITMEKLAKSTIDKDLAEKMAIDNERLRTDLTETRAAMLSYKNMCVVIADQAKNLKLMHERKKDEHDNLMNALREMQSEGVSQERLGKLYFIIMLSRW